MRTKLRRTGRNHPGIARM